MLRVEILTNVVLALIVTLLCLLEIIRCKLRE
jgi:hypothetical protein